MNDKSPQQSLLVIMSKYPSPGNVKTRLAEHIGLNNAAKVAKALLMDLVTAHIGQQYRITIQAPSQDAKHLQDFKDLTGNIPIGIGSKSNLRGPSSQLLEVFLKYLKSYRQVITIYSDVPLLGVTIVKKAFSLLNRFDVVLGPDNDGGYYLVGMKNANDIFSNLPQARVPYLENTVKMIKQLKLSYCFLDTLIDIDSTNDITQLEWSLSHPENEWQRTKKILLKLGLIPIIRE